MSTIAEKELELARIQFDVTIPLQLELNLAQEALHSTLGTSAVLAGTVLTLLDEIGYAVEEDLKTKGEKIAGG